MDDIVSNGELLAEWNIGPNRAWREAKEWNILTESGAEDYNYGRGICWGLYNLN